MEQYWLLLILVPAALPLAWGLRRWRANPLPFGLLLIASVGGAWGLLWAAANLTLLPADPPDPFGSVEYIMREVDYGWLLNYMAHAFGWLFGLAYFGICGLLAWAVPALRRRIEGGAVQAERPTAGDG